MTTQQQRKPMYFNAENYVSALIHDLKMDKADPKVLEDLTMEIELTLISRVNSVVVSSLGPEELFLLNKTLEDHPELDEIDCLSIITPNIPGLSEKIVKAVDDMYGEILDNAKMITIK